MKKQVAFKEVGGNIRLFYSNIYCPNIIKNDQKIQMKVFPKDITSNQVVFQEWKKQADILKH